MIAVVTSRRSLLPLLLLLLGLAAGAERSVAAPGSDDAAAGAPDWTSATELDRRLVTRLLEGDHWPMRVFALLRLERYDGAEITGMLDAALADESWQVRVFALRARHRRGLPPPAEALAEEADARVIRMLLRCGGSMEAERLRRGARTLMRTRRLDELLLGLEVAAASDDAELRSEATRRADVLVKNVDAATLIRASERIARILGADRGPGPTPKTMEEWQAWYAARGAKVELAPPASGPEPLRRGAGGNEPFVATLPDEAFARLLDYLDFLSQRDLQLAVAMDATASMTPMVDEARAGIEDLMVFLNDLARSMELGFVAYRDHDNPPAVEIHRFTGDVDAVRDFLFDVRITGGADLPEAVLDGLEACRGLGWRPEAVRRIIVVGDARPHERDLYAITNLLEEARHKGVDVDLVHVPQRVDDATTRGLPPARAAEWRRAIEEHNERTARDFDAMATASGGRLVTLEEARELVPAIMGLALEPEWRRAFDEFYALYLRCCR